MQSSILSRRDTNVTPNRRQFATNGKSKLTNNGHSWLRHGKKRRNRNTNSRGKNTNIKVKEERKTTEIHPRPTRARKGRQNDTAPRTQKQPKTPSTDNPTSTLAKLVIQRSYDSQSNTPAITDIDGGKNTTILPTAQIECA